MAGLRKLLRVFGKSSQVKRENITSTLIVLQQEITAKNLEKTQEIRRKLEKLRDNNKRVSR